MERQTKVDARGRLLMDDAWVHVQHKTFTKWVNMHLSKHGGKQVQDLETGFEDGTSLVQLIEALSQEKLGRYVREPRIRIQKIGNLNLALDYIKSTGVHLENISGEDICDKNLKLCLGLVWTIIQKFAIADISLEELTAKEALLLWCQRKTESYDNVNVKNFTTSFRDGLAFCALIHKHKPDLIDYDAVSKGTKEEALETAFAAAESLGISRLLDVEDMELYDERPIITYVSEYYHYFASTASQETAARRIGKLIALTKANDAMKNEYNEKAMHLSEWVVKKTEELEDRTFDNTLEGAEGKMKEYGDYITSIKPDKSAEKFDLETLFNNISLKLRNNGRPPFVPDDGLKVQDLQAKWDILEAAERDREDALRLEIRRQRKIKDLLAQFRAKAGVMDRYNEEKQKYLETKEDIDSVATALQQLKIFESHQQQFQHSDARVSQLNSIGAQIIELGAKDTDEVKDKMNSIGEHRAKLVDLANAKKSQLDEALAFQQKLEDMRKQFANMVKDYNRWVNDKIDETSVHNFGDSLDAVVAYAAVMDANDKEITAESESQKSALDKLWDEMVELGVKDNRYTPTTKEDIANTQNNLFENGLGKRREAYAVELARQEALEAKRKEVAEAFGEFVQFLADEHQKIDSFEGEPEPLQKEISEYHDNGSKAAEKLEALNALDSEAKSMGVTENKYTDLSLPVLNAENRKHNNYVANYLAELTEEKEIKDDFDKRVKELVDWVAETIPELQKTEFDNTLAGAQSQLANFLRYKSTSKAEKESDKSYVHSLEKTIVSKLKAGSHKRPEFSPAITTEELENQHWESLKEVEKETEKTIRSELQRQEKLRGLVKRLEASAKAIGEWVSDKENYLKQREESSTLNAVTVQKTIHSSFEEEYAASQSRIDDFKALADEITSDNYVHSDDVRATVDGVVSAWAALQSLSDEKKKALQEDFERFDAKCKEFADAAEEFSNFLEKQREEFDTLEGEPEPLIASIHEFYQDGAKVQEHLEAVSSLAQGLVKMKITENSHTTVTIKELNQKARDFDLYVNGYIAELKEEQELKEDYDRQAEALLAWMDSKIPELENRDTENTLDDARKKVAALNAFRANEKAENFADKAYLEGVSKTICLRLESSAHKRPEFSPKNPVSTLNDKWDALEAVEKARDADLQKELERQEKLDKLVKEFLFEEEEMLSAAQEKEAYLGTEEDTETLAKAQIQKNILDSFEEEHQGSQARLQNFKDLASQITGDNYKDSDSINQKVADMEKLWVDKINDLVSAKKEKLSKSGEEETRKEDLRVQFADKAKAYEKYVRDTVDSLGDHFFGNSLQSVTDHAAKLDESDASTRSESSEKSAELAEIAGQLESSGVTSNKHTNITMEQIEALGAKVEEAIGARRAAYDEELARQQAMEDKRVEFAGEADACAAYLAEARSNIEAVTDGEPSERIAKVKELYNEGKDAQEKVDSVARIDKEAKNMGISENKHTDNTLPYLSNKLIQFNNSVGHYLSSLEQEQEMKERSESLEKEHAKKEENENLKMEYSNEVQNLNMWLDAANDEITSGDSADSLEDAEKTVQAFDQFVADNKSTGEEVIEKLKVLAEKLESEELGVVPALQDLEAKHNTATHQLDERKQTLQDELQKQQHFEQLRKDFADAANGFAEWMNEYNGSLEGISGELEEQLAALNDKVEEKATIGHSKFQEAIAAHNSMAEAQADEGENKHTSLTLPHLQSQWDALSSGLEAKQKLLQEEILLKQGSKITNEQLDQFSESFKLFDKDHLGSLTPLQFSGAVNSLGVAFTKEGEELEAFVAEKIDKTGDGKVNFDEFTSFMVDNLQDKDSEDEILTSFKEISGGKDYVTAEELQGLMSAEEVEYLLENMTPIDVDGVQGYDFTAFTTAAFNR
eukprot:CAMPEP_0174270810 /NCGR_PEP_ID=MMETSP0439-20130205/45801_1 /TAXON_ID=0 /ORGANISM="Stereomyxa ramosa, Strain Chinc5" /LENGTH=1886 /DNA_ID=CAMNT_0015360381 /DNA_START=45 /DNA_END=5705 /DNA_ORIENTATION=-